MEKGEIEMANKVVGIKFDGSSKVYYYLTDKNYAVGQRIKIVTRNEGTEVVTVVDVDSKIMVRNMKYLREA